MLGVLGGFWLPGGHAAETATSGRPSGYRKIMRGGSEWLLSASESGELRPSSVSLTREGGAEGATRVWPEMVSTQLAVRERAAR